MPCLDEALTLEQTYLPADELYEGNEMTGKLYFLNGAAVAGVEDFTIPEGRDASAFINQVSSFLGASLPLDLDSLGTVAELIGETAHLADGQPVWESKSLIRLPSMDQSAEVTIYVTVGTTDNHVYLAEWAADNSSESSGSTQDFSNLDGFNELTREEKNMVSFYADFLEKQMKNQLQQYIDFLKEKHASD